MRKLSLWRWVIPVVLLTFSCHSKPGNKPDQDMNSFNHLLDQYYNDRLKLFPLEATTNGDNRYNDLLPVDISDSYRDTLRVFYKTYLDTLETYRRDELKEESRMSYDILKWDLQTAMEGLRFKDNLRPINQFWSLPLTFGQLGSGKSIQPFKTPGDYQNFLGRIHGFKAWCDTAIRNMERGVATGEVHPRILMERVLPQFKSMLVDDLTQSIFYLPVKNMPKDFPEKEKKSLDSLYRIAIRDEIIPAYKKLYDYIKDAYIPHCRASAGIAAIPEGKEYYNYLIRYWTTTTLTGDEIFEIGQKEVKRLRDEMERVKNESGYTGDLKSFFQYLNTDKKFFPFKTEKEVLAAFDSIHVRMEPNLKQLFDMVPKTKFEIRQTEKFREASASAEYSQGTADGTRPGIFYVPIPDPKKFNTYAMEDLFLHEAIPGHHYQISLQQENTSLPRFRRFIWYGAYGEGWALYTESLGKELGLYTDTYQYFGALSEEMHRAIRLVVDVGIHLKGWTREEAIDFSLENEGESREAVTAEVERYMAIPAQALSYKLGQLKIRELRDKAEKELGSRFNISIFHDMILDSGCMPLAVLESRINNWLEHQKTLNQ